MRYGTSTKKGAANNLCAVLDSSIYPVLFFDCHLTVCRKITVLIFFKMQLSTGRGIKFIAGGQPRDSSKMFHSVNLWPRENLLMKNKPRGKKTPEMVPGDELP